jgi:hypothetical protein
LRLGRLRCDRGRFRLRLRLRFRLRFRLLGRSRRLGFGWRDDPRRRRRNLDRLRGHDLDFHRRRLRRRQIVRLARGVDHQAEEEEMQGRRQGQGDGVAGMLAGLGQRLFQAPPLDAAAGAAKSRWRANREDPVSTLKPLTARVVASRDRPLSLNRLCLAGVTPIRQTRLAERTSRGRRADRAKVEGPLGSLRAVRFCGLARSNGLSKGRPGWSLKRSGATWA